MTFQIDLVEIKARFCELYGKSLEESVRAECSSDFRALLLALIEEK